MTQLPAHMLEDATSRVDRRIGFKVSRILEASPTPSLEGPELREPLGLIGFNEPSVAA